MKKRETVGPDRNGRKARNRSHLTGLLKSEADKKDQHHYNGAKKRSRRPSPGKDVISSFVALSAAPNQTSAQGVAKAASARARQNDLPATGEVKSLAEVVHKRTLAHETVAAARLEYKALYKHELVGGSAQADALEAALAKQTLLEKRERARRKAVRAVAAAAAETVDSKSTGHLRQQTKEEELPALLPKAKTDSTAMALERVLRSGVVDSIGFNPEAALRGPRGWPIVARMARFSDAQEVAQRLAVEFAGEFSALVASQLYQELQEELFAQVEVVLRESYPLVAPLGQQELRRKLREAHAQEATAAAGGDGGGEEEEEERGHGGGGEVSGARGGGVATAANAIVGEGILGRKLALVRRVHALVVKEFNQEHGLRTRSAASANLRRSRRGQQASPPKPAPPEGAVKGSNGRGSSDVVGWGRHRAHKNADDDDDDDDDEDDQGHLPTSRFLHGKALKPIGSRRREPDSLKNGRTTYHAETVSSTSSLGLGGADEEEDDGEGDGNALVIGVSSDGDEPLTVSSRSPFPAAHSSPLSTASASTPKQSPTSSSPTSRSPVNGSEGLPCGREARTLWPSVVKLAENLGMAALRDALKARGVGALTEGVRGPPRHFLLRQRMLEALKREADDADAFDKAERRRVLGESAAEMLGSELGQKQALGAKFLLRFLENPTRAPQLLEPALYRSPAAIGKALLTSCLAPRQGKGGSDSD